VAPDRTNHGLLSTLCAEHMFGINRKRNATETTRAGHVAWRRPVFAVSLCASTDMPFRVVVAAAR